MLEYVKYNLGRKSLLVKEGTAPAIKKIARKRLNKNGPSGGGSRSLHDRERKKDNMLYIYSQQTK